MTKIKFRMSGDEGSSEVKTWLFPIFHRFGASCRIERDAEGHITSRKWSVGRMLTRVYREEL